MQLRRQQSTFGETSVAATTPDPDTVAAFAAERAADGALTIMVIGKSLTGATAATVNLGAFNHAGVAHVWQLTAANTINHLTDISVSGASFGVSLPAQSITLFVVPRNPTASIRPPISASSVCSPAHVNGNAARFVIGIAMSRTAVRGRGRWWKPSWLGRLERRELRWPLVGLGACVLPSSSCIWPAKSRRHAGVLTPRFCERRGSGRSGQTHRSGLGRVRAPGSDGSADPRC
jgi:hypothetical protein